MFVSGIVEHHASGAIRWVARAALRWVFVSGIVEHHASGAMRWVARAALRWVARAALVKPGDNDFLDGRPNWHELTVCRTKGGLAKDKLVACLGFGAVVVGGSGVQRRRRLKFGTPGKQAEREGASSNTIQSIGTGLGPLSNYECTQIIRNNTKGNVDWCRTNVGSAGWADWVRRANPPLGAACCGGCTR